MLADSQVLRVWLIRDGHGVVFQLTERLRRGPIYETLFALEGRDLQRFQDLRRSPVAQARALRDLFGLLQGNMTASIREGGLEHLRWGFR